MNRRAMPVPVLVLLATGVLSGEVERESGPAQGIRTADEAIAWLPPIGRESTWSATSEEWELHPAIAWMSEHLGSGGTLDDWQWRRALSNSRAIQVRERWPVDIPFAVGMRVPAWLRMTAIHLRPWHAGLSDAEEGSTLPGSCGNDGAWPWSRARYHELGRLEAGRQQLVFEVVVERGHLDGGPFSCALDAPPGPPAGFLWTGVLAFRIEVVPLLEDALPGEHGSVLDADVRRLLVGRLEGDPRRLFTGADFLAAPRLANTALSLELTLLEGECETRSFVALPGAPFAAHGVYWEQSVLPEEPLRGSIRVRGRSRDVLRNWDATRYWNGELTIPLSEILR